MANGNCVKLSEIGIAYKRLATSDGNEKGDDSDGESDTNEREEVREPDSDKSGTK